MRVMSLFSPAARAREQWTCARDTHTPLFAYFTQTSPKIPRRTEPQRLSPDLPLFCLGMSCEALISHPNYPRYTHTHTHTHTHSQTNIYSDTFNISHIITVYSL